MSKRLVAVFVLIFSLLNCVYYIPKYANKNFLLLDVEMDSKEQIELYYTSGMDPFSDEQMVLGEWNERGEEVTFLLPNKNFQVFRIDFSNEVNNVEVKGIRCLNNPFFIQKIIADEISQCIKETNNISEISSVDGKLHFTTLGRDGYIVISDFESSFSLIPRLGVLIEELLILILTCSLINIKNQIFFIRTKSGIKKFNMKGKKQVFSLLIVCIYPNLFMYFQNIKEARIVDVLPIMGLFLIAAVLVLAVAILITHDMTTSIALTNIMMLIIINFEILSNVFNFLSHKYICTIAVAFIFISIFTIFLKKKEEAATGFNLIISITFFALIIVNAVPAIPVIIHKMFLEVNKSEILSSIDLSDIDTEEKPNIYYIIFDEYGGRRNLERYFEYDNQQFLEFLSDYDFNISDTSKNEESLDTTTIVPNLLNLDYIAEESMVKEEKLAYMNEPELFKVMQYLGYDIVTCSFWHFLDNSMSIKNFEEEDFFEEKAGYFVLKNSCFIYLYKKYTEYQALNHKSTNGSLVDALQYYKELPCTRGSERPQICIGYYQAPHTPFFYRSDGTLNPEEEYQNWLDHDNYIEYLKWINGNIQEIVKTIIDNDSNSIIIIQSDHGARYPIHESELTGESQFGLDDSYQYYILNCLYYKGEKKDIEGLSGINTLRYILNEEFNTNFEMIHFESNL